MKNRQIWTLLGASVGILILILDGSTALTGARDGIELCLRTVIPSLFPFFVLSILVTGAALGANLAFLRPFGKLFGLPKGTESLLLSAFLGGYPTGAQSVALAYRSAQLSKQDAQRLLAFCNNAGPSFLFGMVSFLFPQKWMAWALWGIHIGSALLVSAVFPGKGSCPISGGKTVTISDAMTTSLRVMAQVCGWVVLFRVVIAFLQQWILWILPVTAQVAVIGLLELSNGCCVLNLIESIEARFIVCSGILAFGGLCVTMQTVSVTKGLSLKHYFMGKGLQTVFSILLSAALVWNPWLLLPTFGIYFLLLPRKMRKNSRNPAPLGV